LENYLEDKVPKETAPHSQIPMTVGDKSNQVSTVDKGILTKLKSKKGLEHPRMEAVVSKALENLFYEQADSNSLEIYRKFIAAVEGGDLMEPKGQSANDYFEQLIQKPELKLLHGYLKRNFAAALQDEAQQVTNLLLKTDPNVISNIWSLPIVFDHIPSYLKRAAEILGEEHFFYYNLKTKQYFFEGLTIKRETSLLTFPDSLYQEYIYKMERALTYDSNAVYIHLQLGFDHLWEFPDHQKSYYHTQKALDLSPNWVLANYVMGWSSMFLNLPAEPYFLKALELDSTILLTYRGLSAYHQMVTRDMEKHRLYRDKLIRKFQHLLKNESEKVPMIYQYILGIELFHAWRIEEALEIFKNCAELTNNQDFGTFQHMGAIYHYLGRCEEGLIAAKKQIELAPFNPEGYLQLAEFYKCLVQIDLAIETLEKVLVLFDTLILKSSILTYSYFMALNSLGELYLDKGQTKTAINYFEKIIEFYPNQAEPLFNSIDEKMYYYKACFTLGELHMEAGRPEMSREYFEKVIELISEPEDPISMNQLGRAYLGLGNIESMEKIINEAIRAHPTDAEYYYQAACLYSLAENEKEALQWLEQALEKGFLEPKWIQEDEDLDNIRQSEVFKALMKKYFPDQSKD